MFLVPTFARVKRNETHWALTCSGMGRKTYSHWTTPHAGLRTTHHTVISGEMDAKGSSGQGSSCPRWFLGVLRTCSSANVLPRTLPLFDLPMGISTWAAALWFYLSQEAQSGRAA